MTEFWLHLVKSVPHLLLRLACSVLAVATVAPYCKPLPSTGTFTLPNLNPTDPLTPLAQLSDWANSAGAPQQLGKWLSGTAADAYAPGSTVWAIVATVALFVTGLVLAQSRFTDGINNLSAPLTFLAIAAIGQAGANPIWPFLVWLALTSLFSYLSSFSDSSKDTHIEAAFAPTIAIVGVFLYPLLLFANLAGFTTSSKSQKTS